MAKSFSKSRSDRKTQKLDRGDPRSVLASLARLIARSAARQQTETTSGSNNKSKDEETNND